MRQLLLTALLVTATCGMARADGPALPLEHSARWVHQRMTQMMAVNDAYLWHEVLGGRAIHQNSSSKPPDQPLRGNFHTQQQSFFAMVKMDWYDLGGRTDPRLLDDARDLLEWVVTNGYDPAAPGFHLNYNTRSGEWNKAFHPEFSMMNVGALLRYDTYRPTPEFVAAAESVLGRIVQTDTFRPDKPKTLYATGYIALYMLDLFDATGEGRFLDWAAQAVCMGDEGMWDKDFGGWFYASRPGETVPRHTVKFTHTNSNMIQACLRLYLRNHPAENWRHALEALEFLNAHSRTADGGWYRHTNRDGSDATIPPIVGDGADSEPGTPCVYDRMAQMIVACALAYRVTEDRKYLRWIDETLDRMERTHLTRYPAGVDYGYINAGDYQNTWCHLWGQKAMLALARLWRDYGE